MKSMGHSLLALENRLQAEGASTDGPAEVVAPPMEESATLAISSNKTCDYDEHEHDYDHKNQFLMRQQAEKKDEIQKGEMVNFITDRPLGQEQKEVIYELTRKKRQSKKSTMSEKQQLARQQLARELKLERRDPIDIDSIRYATFNTTLNRSYSMILVEDLHDRTSSVGGSFRDKEGSLNGSKSHPKLSPSMCSCGRCNSFSGSDKSYGASTSSQQDSGAGQLLLADDLMGSHNGSLESEILHGNNRKKEATIRVKRSRLEQLNAELETRLYQYEYLVAQEKAILGSYNMMLFTNKGVNNFHKTQNLL